MTTIASDGRTVAADGLSTSGEEPISYDFEKIRLVSGNLYAITGHAAYFDACIEWHLDGANGKAAPSAAEGCDWQLLVFYPDYAERYTSKVPYADRYPYPCAFGSGADFATAALDLGHSPRDAIAVAARKNVYTGGTIMELPIPQTVEMQEAAE